MTTQPVRYGVYISTWTGVDSSGLAEHFYGTLWIGGYGTENPEHHEIERVLGAEEAATLNVKDGWVFDEPGPYKAGGMTHRFNSYGDILEAAIACALHRWGPDITLEVGEEFDSEVLEIPLKPWRNTHPFVSAYEHQGYVYPDTITLPDSEQVRVSGNVQLQHAQQLTAPKRRR